MTAAWRTAVVVRAQGAEMDADQAATVFVEICTRLDVLIEEQRRTNDLLGDLEAAVREHLEASAEDSAPAVSVRRPRGLGHLIPYGDDDVRLPPLQARAQPS
jgi:hypothetical protein